MSWKTVYYFCVLRKWINGETINCKIIEYSDETIKYKIQDQDVTRNLDLFYNELDLLYIEGLVFNNENVEKINKKAVVSGIDDWRNIVIINDNEIDMSGFQIGKTLKYKKTMMGVSGSVDMEALRSDGLTEIKKEAAQNKYQMLVIKKIDKRVQKVFGKKITRKSHLLEIVAIGYSYN